MSPVDPTSTTSSQSDDAAEAVAEAARTNVVARAIAVSRTRTARGLKARALSDR